MALPSGGLCKIQARGYSQRENGRERVQAGVGSDITAVVGGLWCPEQCILMADLEQRDSGDLGALLLDAIPLKLTVDWQRLGGELGEMGWSDGDLMYTISIWYCLRLRGWTAVIVGVAEELVEAGAAIVIE